MRRVEPVTFATVRRVMRALPGVEEGTSYGTAAFRVRGKFLVRLREDGDSLVVTQVEDMERELLIAGDPEAFYVTDHYLGYPTVLVRLSRVREDDLAELLERSWRRLAPKRLVADYDSRA